MKLGRFAKKAWFNQKIKLQARKLGIPKPSEFSMPPLELLLEDVFDPSVSMAPL